LPGPGRPRGRDLRALVDKKARETGVDVDDALWGIVRAMVTAARGGDVAAARELFNRLCDNDPLAVTVDLAAPPPGPPVPQDLGAYVAAFAEAVDELQARERENAAKAGKPAQH
jgi:hypothetical protein